MGKMETIEEMIEAHPNEWLLFVDYEADEMNRPKRGILVAHSKDRSEIYKQMKKYKGKVGVRYAGKLPKDVEVMFLWEL